MALLILLGFCAERALAQQQATVADKTPTAVSTAVSPNETQAQESRAPLIPEEFNEETRAAYEEKLKTLHVRMEDQKWEEALITADELIKVRSREPQVRFIRTIALTELGRDEEAKSELLALISDFPELPEPRNNLAAMYAKAGEFALAQRELETAIAAVPDYAVAHANLADLYLQMALQHYQKAVATNKDAAARRDLNMRLENLRALLAPKTAATEMPVTEKTDEEKSAADHATPAEQENSKDQ